MTEPPATALGSDGPRRLDPRTVPASALATVVVLLGAAVPAGIGLRLAGTSWGWTLLWTLGGSVVGTAALATGEWIRWRCTTFRVTASRVERAVSFLGTARTSVSRDRIRTLDVTADPAQRLLGVADLRLGSGDAGGDIRLRSLATADAEQLRRTLLARTAGATDSGTRVGELTRWQPAWLRYAPVSIWTPALGGLAFGAVLQVANWFNAEAAVLRWVFTRTSTVPLWLEVVGFAALGIVVGAIAQLALTVEGWWNYTLTREPDGSLRLRRGLLVQRSTTFDESRIRGVVVVEPPGIRLLGAARLEILATGLRRDQEDQRRSQPGVLVPAAPRAVVLDVARSVLGTAVPTTLTTHPAAAQRRRWVRAAAVFTVVEAALALLAVLLTPVLGWIAVAAAVPLALLCAAIARDNAAGLGHAVGERHLVLRSGSLLRRTSVLQRVGLTGWVLRSSPLQRRAGLLTLTATTATGSGGIRLPDVGGDQGAALVIETDPVWRHLLAEPATVDAEDTVRR